MFVQVAFGKEPFATNAMLYTVVALVARVSSVFKVVVVEVAFKCIAWKFQFLVIV